MAKLPAKKSTRPRATQDLVEVAGGVKVPRAEVRHIVVDLWTLAVPVASLKLDPQNVRRHPDRNKLSIRQSLDRNGQQKPISVDADGIILAGNGTYEQAVALGWKYIARVRSNLTGAAARAWAIQDNRTGELSEWDAAELQSTLQELGDLDIPAIDLGWSDGELDSLMDGDFEDAHAFAEKPAKPEKPPKEKPAKLMLIATFNDEKQQAVWLKRMLDEGVDVQAQ